MGEYGAIYAYLALYTWLATFGLEPILAREAAQRRAQAGCIFLVGTVVASCFSVAGIALAFLLAPSFGYGASLRTLVFFAAMDILFLPALSLIGIVFQVDMRQWYSVGLGLLRQMLWLLAVGLLVLGRAGVFWVVLSRTLVGFVAAASILPFCWKRSLFQDRWSFSWNEARTLVRYALPLVLTTGAVGIYHRIDQVMLHKMAGDKALGPYVVAVQLTELFSALPVALMSSLFPVLAQTANDDEQFRHYLGTSYRVLMVVAFAACAVITPIAAPMVDLFYGRDFRLTAGLLIVLIWSEVPVFFGVVMSNALIARGLQWYLPFSTIVGAISNVVLNFVVIPSYGALGSAWATVASYCLAAIFLFVLFDKTRPMAWQGLRIALPPFLLALGVTLVLTLLSSGFVWKLIVACIAYPIGAWVSGTVRRDEVEHAVALVRKNLPYARA